VGRIINTTTFISNLIESHYAYAGAIQTIQFNIISINQLMYQFNTVG